MNLNFADLNSHIGVFSAIKAIAILLMSLHISDQNETLRMSLWLERTRWVFTVGRKLIVQFVDERIKILSRIAIMYCQYTSVLASIAS